MPKNTRPLADTLNQERTEIENYLYLGKVKWEKLIAAIRSQAEIQNLAFSNEQILTFLMACGYALSGKAGLHELTKILTGSDLQLPPNPKIWFETLPLTPRQKEGNTNVDLALGMISRRSSTKSGIQLDVTENTWVCFCEMKYDSDISPRTTNDVNRNQLLRVIENALCFQNSGKLTDNIYVTLVTRQEFQGKLVYKSYREQFEKYRNNPDSIQRDLNNSHLPKRVQSNWHYPRDISEAINKLHLNWVSYEELFSRLPMPSESSLYQLYQEIKRFWEF
jgi:hypothetical protein